MGIETVTLLALPCISSQRLARFVQYVADPDQLQTLVFWMLGSLLRATWTKSRSMPASWFWCCRFCCCRHVAHRIACLQRTAVVLGIRVERLRFTMLLAAALLAGISDGHDRHCRLHRFVAPHMARMLVGEDQRLSLPVTAACCMLVLTLSSLRQQADPARRGAADWHW